MIFTMSTGKLLEVGERREATAEVVERKPATQGLDLTHEGNGVPHVGHCSGPVISTMRSDGSIRLSCNCSWNHASSEGSSSTRPDRFTDNDRPGILLDPVDNPRNHQRSISWI